MLLRSCLDDRFDCGLQYEWRVLRPWQLTQLEISNLWSRQLLTFDTQHNHSHKHVVHHHATLFQSRVFIDLRHQAVEDQEILLYLLLWKST